MGVWAYGRFSSHTHILPNGHTQRLHLRGFLHGSVKALRRMEAQRPLIAEEMTETHGRIEQRIAPQTRSSPRTSMRLRAATPCGSMLPPEPVRTPAPSAFACNTGRINLPRHSEPSSWSGWSKPETPPDRHLGSVRRGHRPAGGVRLQQRRQNAGRNRAFRKLHAKQRVEVLLAPIADDTHDSGVRVLGADVERHRKGRPRTRADRDSMLLG